jgi:hypothetical protein
MMVWRKWQTRPTCFSPPQQGVGCLGRKRNCSDGRITPSRAVFFVTCQDSPRRPMDAVVASDGRRIEVEVEASAIQECLDVGMLQA